MAKENLGKIVMTPKGGYDSTVAYEFLDIVTYNGSSYLCKKTSTGNEPTKEEYWQPIANKGDKPILGEDYFTEEDKNEMADAVSEGARSNFDSYYNGKVEEFNSHNDHIVSANEELFNALPSDTASGSDINITYGKECRLLSSNIKGKCVQDGTPTPTAPVEIEVNKGYRNIFNIPYTENNKLTYTAKKTDDFVLTDYYVELEAGKKYTFSCKTSGTFGGASTTQTQCFLMLDKAFATVWVMVNKEGYTFTPTVSGKYYLRYDVNVTGETHSFWDFQIEEGDVAHKYVPYGNGFNIVTNTKNLFSGYIKGIKLDSTKGTEGNDTTSATSDFIPVNYNKNEVYYLSGLSNNLWTFVGAYNNKKEFLGRSGANPVSKLSLNKDNFKSGTAQGTGDIAYLRVTTYENNETSGKIDDIDNLNVQLEKGTVATDWVPYQHNSAPINLKGNELWSLGDVKDELIIENDKAKIIKRIGKVIFNGSEEITRNPTYDDHYRYTIFLELHNNIIYPQDYNQLPIIINNYFDIVNGNSTWGSVATPKKTGISLHTALNTSNNLTPFFISYESDETATLELFKEWLSKNNITVYYLLAEPYEIDLGTISKLPKTFDGANNITVDTNIEDTEMDIKYVLDIKAYIDNK